MSAERLQHGPVRRYRQVVRVLFQHGFGYLVDQLGLTHLVPFPWVLLGHGREAPRTQAAHLRLALEELGATFIKLGQILSTRADLLPPEFTAELSRLQDSVPPEPLRAIEAQIARELGGATADLYATFDPQPLGSASIGQVHAATLPSGEEVVVKVQRPGLERMVEEDLAILMDLARLAGARTPWGQVYDLPALVEEFGETLRGELDYVREGANAERIRRNFAGETVLQVPTIYWSHTTRRVLTMEHLTGIKIDDVAALEAAGIDRHRLAAAGVQSMLKMVLEDGFFHADPHPGNLLVRPGPAISLLDYGMVGVVDQRKRENILHLFLAVVDEDIDRMVDQLAALGVAGTPRQFEHLKGDLARLMSRYWGLPLGQLDIRRILEEVMATARHHRLQMPANLSLIAKALVMYEALARQLDPGFNLAEEVTPYVRALALRTYLPRHWLERLAPTLLGLSQLTLSLPQRAGHLLHQAEKGDLAMNIRLPEGERMLRQLDHMVNRLLLGVVAAGLAVGTAILLQVYHTRGLAWPVGVLLWAQFAIVAGLALWLIFAILLRGRH